MATYKYDLVIVGAGSGNMLPAPEFADWRIAVVEADRFGGTCLNRGCIPSKMLVDTADVAQAVRHAGNEVVSLDVPSNVAGRPALTYRTWPTPPCLRLGLRRQHVWDCPAGRMLLSGLGHRRGSPGPPGWAGPGIAGWSRPAVLGVHNAG
jgi:hypothetical protein